MNASQLRPVAMLLDPQDRDLMPLPWEEAGARIDAARFCFLTTLHASGRPHTRPVLAVWAAESLCTTSAPTAQKGRNLRADPRCSVAVMADDMHIVLEGTAWSVHGNATLKGVAEAYRAKYGWPVTVAGDGGERPVRSPRRLGFPLPALHDNPDGGVRLGHQRHHRPAPHSLVVLW